VFHVVSGCSAQDIILLGMQGLPIKISNVVVDDTYDLALLTPAQEIKAPTLSISANDRHLIGAQVSTWGYPEGYTGLAWIPMLVF
jgi:hypothetical protein